VLSILRRALLETALPEYEKAGYNNRAWWFRIFYRRYAKNYSEKHGLLAFL